MGLFADCSPWGEFLVRNCLEQSARDIRGVLILRDLKIHHYPKSEEELPESVKMKLQDCHNTDRLAVTT